MTDTKLPAPLVPAEVDLRNFEFMPLETDRLLKSETWVLGSGDQRAAAMTLWLESWHQVPAGSLPDNDKMLAHLSQCPKWSKVRAHALRGWVACSDGRLYHPVVCAKVLEAWIEKLSNSLSGATGNAKRWNVDVDLTAMREQFIKAVAMLRALAPQSKTLAKKIVVTIVAGSPPDKPPKSPPDNEGTSGGDRKGHGQRHGQGQGQGNPPAPPPPAPPPSPPPPEPGSVPTPMGAMCLRLKAVGILPEPGHEDFKALVASDAEWAEFEPHVSRALLADRPFRYLVGAVVGERRRVASRGASSPAPRPTNRQQQLEDANRAIGERWAAQQQETEDHDAP